MSRQMTFVIALAMTAMTSHLHAGMSGASARVQEVSNAEAEPQPKAAATPRAPGSSFDGTWSVAASPGCGLSGRSSVRISRGRIFGPHGLSGSIDVNGNVRTIARGAGLSVISTGHAAANTGSGTYRVSNGCTGSWSARKA